MMQLLTKIINLIKRGYVSNSLPDTADYSQVQVSYMENFGKAAVISPYGLYSRLPLNTDVLIFSVNSNENNRACIGFSREDRFKNLEEGEVLLGNPKTGSYIKFSKDAKIEVLSKSDINLNITGNVNLTATDVNVTASGSVAVDSPSTTLGVGGNQIARLGDTVTTLISGTPYNGTITSAGVNTSI